MALNSNSFIGFGCGGYRSFCDTEIARIGPFEKVQVIAGQNNCGKSSLVDFIIKMVGSIDESGQIRDRNKLLCPDDVPLAMRESSDECSPTISFCIDKDVLMEGCDSRNPRFEVYRDDFLELFSNDPYEASDGEGVWLDFVLDESRNGAFPSRKIFHASYSQYEASGLRVDLQKAALALCGSASDAESCYEDIIDRIMPWGLLPEFVKVNAIRAVEDADLPNGGRIVNSGVGLPSALLRLANPERRNHVQAERRFGKLQGFVRDVLNDRHAELNVAHESHEISVKTFGSDYLPLEALGTGITELLILASVIACNENKIICIEEPEIHLHPALQARFMRYLREDDLNRFIVTTHSPTIINAAGVQVAHVSKIEGVSSCKQLDGLPCARTLLDDLGARASDLLQANYIIWVEGPSDRIYLNHWIGEWSRKRGINLEEGIHYSVMIYGGRLLNALDANAGDGNENLISLFRLNTHFCVLMDSDKESSRAKISASKRRIADECGKSGAMSWITWGSTIENYVPSDALEAAIKEVHPGKKWNHDLGSRYVCPLSFIFSGKKFAPNKIAVAKAACNAGFEPLGDVRARVDDLCRCICHANGITTGRPINFCFGG